MRVLFRRRWVQDHRRKHAPKNQLFGWTESKSMFFLGPFVFQPSHKGR